MMNIDINLAMKAGIAFTGFVGGLFSFYKWYSVRADARKRKKKIEAENELERQLAEIEARNEERYIARLKATLYGYQLMEEMTKGDNRVADRVIIFNHIYI